MNAETKLYDIVVVGGGGSGMMAAMIAARQGASVLVLEKTEKTGGTTALAVGAIMAAGGRYQKQNGIIDTPEEHAEDLDEIRKAQRMEDCPLVRRLLVKNAADTIDVLESIGVTFNAPMEQFPHRNARMHMPVPAAYAYAFQLRRQLRKLGVPVKVNARVRSLVVEDGRVVGVVAHIAGLEQQFRARKGVILATGDISGSSELMHRHTEGWVDGIQAYNPNSTGDGQAIAAAIGGQIVSRKDVEMEFLARLRFVGPKRNLMRLIPPYSVVTRFIRWSINNLPTAIVRAFVMNMLTSTLAPDKGLFLNGAILVNMRGERFLREVDGNFMDLARQPEGSSYLVFDHKFARKFNIWPHFVTTVPSIGYSFVDDFRRSRRDLFNMAPTAAGLAAKIGVDAAALVRTLKARAEEEEQTEPLNQAPYYALGPLKLWIMIAPVGLAINERLQVLDESGQPLEGLYAAGGSGQSGFTISGHGHGLGWALTSGRLAALSALSSDE